MDDSKKLELIDQVLSADGYTPEQKMTIIRKILDDEDEVSKAKNFFAQ